MADTSTAATSQSSTGQATDPSAVAAAQSAAVASTPTQTSQTSSATTAPTRPEWVPESCFDAKTGVNWDSYGKYHNEQIVPKLTQLAAEEVRRNTLATKPDDVKLDLPKDFKLPEGMDFKLDSTKPEFNKFREIAVKRGLDADTVSELMGVYAETVVGSEATYAAAKKAELDKLGANATARVTSLNTFFEGHLGAEDAKFLRSSMYAAGVVTAMEKLVAKFTSQGAASFSQAHREPGGQTGRVSEEAYAKMSAAERWDYARGFDQKQFQNGAR